MRLAVCRTHATGVPRILCERQRTKHAGACTYGWHMCIRPSCVCAPLLPSAPFPSHSPVPPLPAPRLSSCRLATLSESESERCFAAAHVAPPDESLPKIEGTVRLKAQTPTRTHARTDVHREQWSPQHSPLPRALYSECFESPPGSPIRETIQRHPSVYHEIAVAEAGIARGLREVRRALREGARSVAEDKTMLTYHPSSNALIRQV